MSMVKMRMMVEREIVTMIIDDALAAGYEIAVDNGGDGFEYRGTDKARITDHTFAADDARLYLFRPGEKKSVGWVYCVYGNDGWDVISDYTTNLEKLLEGAFTVSKKYEG